MRNLVIILFLLINATTLFAQSSISDLYKQWAFEDINNGHFNSAVSNLIHIDDWSISDYLEPDSVISFMNHIYHLDFSSAIVDSLYLYVSKELKIIGKNYYSNGDYEMAKYIYNQQFSWNVSYIGLFNVEHSILLNNLGLLYSDLGEYEKVEKYYIEALNIMEKISEETSIEYAVLLSNLATTYEKLKEYAKAEKYYLEALDIYTKNLETTLPYYTIILQSLGQLYMETEKYTTAERYFLDLLNVLKSNSDIYQVEHNMVLNTLTLMYSRIGNYHKAEQYALEALDWCKSEIGTSHPQEYATTLNNLGNLYLEIGDYQKAEQFCIMSVEFHKDINSHQEIDDVSQLEYANALNTLGQFYLKTGDPIKAQKNLLDALNIRKMFFDLDPTSYIGSLNNLGQLYWDIGDYPRAEKYLNEALSILKSSPEDLQEIPYATIIGNLGQFYLDMQNFEVAEKFCVEAMQIKKRILGVNHPDYAIALNNVGMCYVHMGDYNKAERYLIESLDILKNTIGALHPNYALVLDNMGALYSGLKNYEKAIEYHSEAFLLSKDILGTSHPNCYTSLNNLATTYLDMRNYESALFSFAQLLHISRNTFNKFPKKYATVLDNIGMCYAVLNKKAKAKKCLLKALNIRKHLLGQSHSDYILSLHNLGSFYYLLGDFAKTEKYLSETFAINQDIFSSAFSYMTEEQRYMYVKTKYLHFDSYPTFTYKYHFSQPSISTFAYDNELFRKGLLLSSSNIIRQSILESNDSILIEQWNELVGTKQVIMNLEEKDPTSTNLAHYKNQADSLEKIVTKSSAIFRETKQQQSITRDSIQQYLNPDEVAIEYFIAPLNEDSTMYCALLLRHDSQYPELIPLCEEKEIVNCLSQNRTNDIYTFDTNSKTIFNLIWDKILPQIHEGETIYFSPAGLLHQIAIENIPYDQTHTMSDVYTMVRLSSTREIVKKDKNIKHYTATIYGGIFYDVDKTSLLAESRNYDTEDMFAYRSISSTLPNRGSVLYLPGTKKEAESIHSLLNSNNITSTLYTASKANEESFKSLSGKHRNILHIGTHGFYWEDSTARKQDYFSQRIQLQMLGDNQLQKPSIDPLTRCGLLFAGSNIALSGHSNDLPEGVQDGILTAKEISLMDLHDADLVVLSACETAKGDITSEGIFGLQRAFKMAGVQTIIMSLWKVNDQATQMLMTEFYTNWISKNQSKREAFKNAQNTVRAKFEEPEYWAGFILLD